jgi:hypothetical protein
MVGILSRKGIRRGGGSPLNFCSTLLNSLFLNQAVTRQNLSLLEHGLLWFGDSEVRKKTL